MPTAERHSRPRAAIRRPLAVEARPMSPAGWPAAPHRTVRWPGTTGAALLLLLASCGGGAPGARAVDVRGAWARATSGPNAAAYLTVHNNSDALVTIVAARSPAAAAVTLHETLTMGAGAHAMVHMTPLAQVGLAPGDSAVFAPAGKHLMFERVRAPFVAGARVPVTLVTADGAELRSEVEVRAP